MEQEKVMEGLGWPLVVFSVVVVVVGIKVGLARRIVGGGSRKGWRRRKVLVLLFLFL